MESMPGFGKGVSGTGKELTTSLLKYAENAFDGALVVYPSVQEGVGRNDTCVGTNSSQSFGARGFDFSASFSPVMLSWPNGGFFVGMIAMSVSLLCYATGSCDLLLNITA